MSANYFVDSLISNEPPEVLKASAHFTDMCSSPFLSADCSHLSPRGFASKNAVFTSAWDPGYSQKPVFYAKHPGICADSRFLQPWIEPAVSGRNYDLKLDDFSDTRHKENSAYFYNPSTPTKIQQINTSPLSSGQTKEEKPELDPSKLLTLHMLPQRLVKIMQSGFVYCKIQTRYIRFMFLWNGKQMFSSLFRENGIRGLLY